MLTYRPPLQDFRFLARDVFGIDAETADMLDSVCEAVGRFVVDRVLPLNAGADRVGCTWSGGEVRTPPGFVDAYADWRAQGWPTLCAAPEQGGQGLPEVAAALTQELLCAASHAFQMLASVNHCASQCLARAASPALQAEWLPRLASGEVLAAMCMTEPQAGSDLGLLRTSAEPAGDGSWRLHGTKIFASSGDHDATDNILQFVLARAKGAPPGSRGLSLFVVPKRLADGRRNTVTCDGIEHKTGLHGNPTCTLRYDGAVGWLVGEQDQGLGAMFHMMNQARLSTGLQGVGMSDIAWQNALAYAQERRQGRGPNGEHPCRLVDHADVRRMLLTQRAWTEGGRALAFWTATLVDQSRAAADPAARAEADDLLQLLTPVVKGFLSDNAQQSLYLATQVFGGHGYVAETGIEQLVRDARVTTLYEGTTGIQGGDLLARKVLGAGGVERARRLESHVRDWITLAAAVAPLRAMADDAQQTLAAWSRVTDDLRRRQAEGGLDAGTVAVAYLRLLGHVLFAGLWCRMAACALADGHAGTDFAAAKVATARHYFAQLRPEVACLIEQTSVQPADLEAGLKL